MDRFSTEKESKYSHRYSEGFKRKMCLLYVNSEDSLNGIESKNNIGKGRLIRWLTEYGYSAKKCYFVEKSIPLQMPTQEEKTTENISEAELKRLKAELSQAKFEAEAYRKLLEIAEREFKIEILKKFDTKQ